MYLCCISGVFWLIVDSGDCRDGGSGSGGSMVLLLIIVKGMFWVVFGGFGGVFGIGWLLESFVLNGKILFSEFERMFLLCNWLVCILFWCLFFREERLVMIFVSCLICFFRLFIMFGNLVCIVMFDFLRVFCLLYWMDIVLVVCCCFKWVCFLFFFFMNLFNIWNYKFKKSMGG